MKEIKFIAGYVKRHAFMYVIGIAALFLVDLFSVYIPQYTGMITDGIESGSLNMEGIARYVLIILLLGTAVALGRFGWRYFIFGPSRAIERELRNDMFAHLETLSARYFNEHKTGDLMAHFTNDLNQVRMLLGNTVITAFDATIMLFMVLFRMIQYVSLKLTVVAVIPLLIIIIGDYAYGRIMYGRFLAKQNAFSDLSDQVQESVSGIRVIKAFVQERRQMRAFEKINRYNEDKNLSVVRLQAFVMPLLDFIVGLSSLLTLLYGGYLAISGEITVGQFVAFNQYISMLVWPMIAVGECITSISQGLASLKRIVRIFDEQPDIVDGPQMDPSIDHLEGDIEFDDLTFSYPDERETEVLTDISFKVDQGSTLAVLGRTGSGKSTISTLLLRMFDTDGDEIRIDSHPLRAIPLSVLRRDIAYVPQDSFLFSDTIENNIAFGVGQTDHDAVLRAAEAACIHDEIMEFPDGYSTLVGERGVTLSGGQKQRCAIARALLKDAPVLILDDALSAVDTDTEERILENLRSLRRDRTTLIIAHRISTIQNADHILVLDEGRAVEYGTHDELMAENGLYRSIYEKQQLEKQLYEEGGEQG